MLHGNKLKNNNMSKKKSITMTIDEWYEILHWCETYCVEWYHDEGTPERLQEELEFNNYWQAVNKLKTKLKSN
jgi:hypothetical protein